ncbi:Uncharacterised protein [Neisseria zoodegmatis]|uniref:Uncharacterized protein n=1 Tax=Neisseria zoodegmatis TaxID=326523 RepID=A0A378WV84_9NEIS|nr:Uncharacterised protein [Neisseria zoodegmatis]
MKKYLAGALALLWSAVSLAAVNINTATAEELKRCRVSVRRRRRRLWSTVSTTVSLRVLTI